MSAGIKLDFTQGTFTRLYDGSTGQTTYVYSGNVNLPKFGVVQLNFEFTTNQFNQLMAGGGSIGGTKG